MSPLLGLALGFMSNLPVTVDGALVHPRRLILSVSGKSAPLVEKGDRLLWHDARIGYAAVEVPYKQLVQRRTTYRTHADVLRVDLDRAAKPAYDPNDPRWPDMWHFRNLNIDLAWNTSLGSTTQVAVIDTGVMVAHPDLADNVWTNGDEVPNNGIDDDLNGYVDDVNGYDFAYNDGNPNDVYGHGTPCAGLVGAVQDNAIGVTGAAPRAQIMAIKACIDEGYFYDSMTIPAYMYAADNGARVFSMSFYSDRVSAGEQAALAYAVGQGVLPVVAAGNDSISLPYYPAAYDICLSVAALNQNNSKAGFSNYGSWVDVASPGVGLSTTSNGGGYTSGFAGTSGACPQIAGIATLLFGARPAATAAEVRAAIEDTSTNVGSYLNYGIVDAEAALQALLTTPAAPKSARFWYVTPSGYDTAEDRFDEQVVRIQGRAFQAPNTVEVTVNGEVLPIVERQRDFVDVILGSARGTLVVKVNGLPVTSQALPSEARTVYGACDANPFSTNSYNGGFAALLEQDGIELSRGVSDGNSTFVAVFRRVSPQNTMLLHLARRGATTAAGDETIQVYNWSSASYPYGNWTTLTTGPLPLTTTETTLTINNARDHVDPEGTMYIRVQGTGMDANSSLRVDRLNLVKP